MAKKATREFWTFDGNDKSTEYSSETDALRAEVKYLREKLKNSVPFPTKQPDPMVPKDVPGPSA